jgi:hypothetical protein
VGLISSSRDALKKDNGNAVQRREAQDLMLDCATLDLVVVTTLISQVWVDDDLAGEVFGERERCWCGRCTTGGWRRGR